MRPTSVKSVADNTTVLDYTTALKSIDHVRCMVQAQDLTQMVESEGLFYPVNIEIWTYVKGFDSNTPFLAKDKIDLTGVNQIEGIQGKFLLIMVTPALDSRGKFSHMRMRATMDLSR